MESIVRRTQQMPALLAAATVVGRCLRFAAVAALSVMGSLLVLGSWAAGADTPAMPAQGASSLAASCSPFVAPWNCYDSGYSVSLSGQTSSTLSAQFTVPTVGCHLAGCTPACPTAYRAVGPFSAIYDTTGSASYPWLLIGCSGSKPIIRAYLTLRGVQYGPLNFSVKAGDIVTMSVSMSSQATTVTFTDGAFTRSKTGAGAAPASAFVSIGPVSNGSKLTGVPQFTRLTFTNILVDGTTFTDYTTGRLKYIRTSNGTAPPSSGGTGIVQILPSNLGISGGVSYFYEDWVHW
jgi:hypothetical protein